MIAGYSFKHYTKSELRNRLFQLVKPPPPRSNQRVACVRFRTVYIHLTMSKIYVIFLLSIDHFQSEVLYKIQLWIYAKQIKGKLSELNNFKGTDRLCKIVELSMQCCGKLL